MKEKGILRIGTSGIVIPGSRESRNDLKHKSRLNYYSSLFNTIEINSTFKKPGASTFEKWSQNVWAKRKDFYSRAYSSLPSE